MTSGGKVRAASVITVVPRESNSLLLGRRALFVPSAGFVFPGVLRSRHTETTQNARTHRHALLHRRGRSGRRDARLSARPRGIDVVVLEKHADFFRDFAATPSIIDAAIDARTRFARRISHAAASRDPAIPRPDRRHAAHRRRHDARAHVCKFLVLMPQWEFLNFLAEAGRRYPSFRLLMETTVTDLITKTRRARRAHANGRRPGEIRAELIVGADGRGSTVRAAAGLEVLEIGVPMDVLWMRVSRRPDDPAQVLGRIDYGKMMVMLDRGDYWQCAYAIRKGASMRCKARASMISRRDPLARTVARRARRGVA